MKPFLKAYQRDLSPAGALLPKDSPLLSFLSMLRFVQEKVGSILFFRFRLLPVVIFFAVLVLGARVTTFFGHMGQEGFFQKLHASAASDKNKSTLGKLDTRPNKKKKGLQAMDEFDPFNMTAEQYQALKGIVSKRDQLSDRERSISEKEQVLQALIKKMDEKVAELKEAKDGLEQLIGKIDEEENANTKRLVKMTEAMKPIQAARVLEGIEFPILLEIMETMKEKKASAILASMDAEKAGYLMTAMSKRRKVFKKDNPAKGIMKG